MPLHLFCFLVSASTSFVNDRFSYSSTKIGIIIAQQSLETAENKQKLYLEATLLMAPRTRRPLSYSMLCHYTSPSFLQVFMPSFAVCSLRESTMLVAELLFLCSEQKKRIRASIDISETPVLTSIYNVLSTIRYNQSKHPKAVPAYSSLFYDSYNL